MELLQIQDILLINKKTIERHGGNFTPPFNILREGALDYLVEAVDGELFGEPMYPDIANKAAFYMFQIVTGHIFQDGNKRTGLEATLLFLKLNGYYLNDPLVKIENSKGQLVPSIGENSNKILENFTLEMADGIISFDECKLWFEANIIDPGNGME
jgi:death-on-curing protein